ncbi:MAG: hypothetical protein IID33_06430, partial [Planctomycetes bacterium]|nr:hypothetical protein [Planctomycetota bacterium]
REFDDIDAPLSHFAGHEHVHVFVEEIRQEGGQVCVDLVEPQGAAQEVDDHGGRNLACRFALVAGIDTAFDVYCPRWWKVRPTPSP